MTVQKPQNSSLIESISAGFTAINRRLWLILIPLALNVYLWYGAPLSFRPLFSDIAAAVATLPVTPGAPSTPQTMGQQIAMLGQLDMRRWIVPLNIVPTLSLWQVNHAAEDAGLFPVQELPLTVDDGAANAIQVRGFSGLLLVLVLFNAPALVISALYLTKLAESVREDRASWWAWLRRSGVATVSQLGVAGIITVIVLLLGVPLLIFWALLIQVSPPLGGIIFALALLFIFWARIFIGFAPEAITVSGVGPLRALYASFHIVRQNLWGTLGLLALNALITVGSGLIWYNLAPFAAGTWIAIIGSAYLGSGLAAARMAFYYERLRRWRIATMQVAPFGKLG